jgi:hypothetical protein
MWWLSICGALIEDSNISLTYFTLKFKFRKPVHACVIVHDDFLALYYGDLHFCYYGFLATNEYTGRQNIRLCGPDDIRSRKSRPGGQYANIRQRLGSLHVNKCHMLLLWQHRLGDLCFLSQATDTNVGHSCGACGVDLISDVVLQSSWTNLSIRIELHQFLLVRCPAHSEPATIYRLSVVCRPTTSRYSRGLDGWSAVLDCVASVTSHSSNTGSTLFSGSTAK